MEVLTKVHFDFDSFFKFQNVANGRTHFNTSQKAREAYNRMYFCLQLDGPINGGGGGLIMGSLQYVKGVTFVNRRYTKEAPCLSMVYKSVRGWTLVGVFPYKTLVSTPLVMGHSSNQFLLASFSCFKTMPINIVISFPYRTSLNNNICY